MSAVELVVIDVMRHGEKDGDRLTAFGREQVGAAARKHLFGRGPYHRLLSSGKTRAIETVIVAADAIGCYPEGKLPIIERHEGFGFEGYDGPELPSFPWNDVVGLMTARGITEPRVYDVLDVWPIAWAIRERVTEALREVAFTTWIEHRRLREGFLRVFVGSHTPIAEMGVGDPRVYPQLNPADMIRYSYRVNDYGARQVGAEFLPCPLTK